MDTPFSFIQISIPLTQKINNLFNMHTIILLLEATFISSINKHEIHTMLKLKTKLKKNKIKISFLQHGISHIHLPSWRGSEMRPHRGVRTSQVKSQDYCSCSSQSSPHSKYLAGGLMDSHYSSALRSFIVLLFCSTLVLADDHEIVTPTNSFRSTMRCQSNHRLIIFDWTAGWFFKIQQSPKIHQARHVLC